MKFINTYIIKKFDVSNINIDLPIFYTNYKNETKLAYLLLNYIYYNKYNKNLDFSLLTRDKNKKPIFCDNSLYFNISHSNNYVACCLSNINIGIDIEEDRNIKDSVLNKFMHIDDKIYDINFNPINIWNIKEAYSKYLGIGLKLNFKKISIIEIKQKVNLINNTYLLENKNIYFSLCFDKYNIIENDIKFINKTKLLNLK